MPPPQEALPAQAFPAISAPSPPVSVDISSLVSAGSPRLLGVNQEHAEALAEIDGNLPPILIQRSTMRVIDGMHRVDAARIRGEEKICAQFVDCADDEAFLMAVAANIKHGLPLTLADRRTAALRIIQLRPEASDRWIGKIAGLADKTIAAIRRSEAGSIPQPDRRVGRDGRVRPLNAAEGRRVAGDLLTANPSIPLHQVAQDAGISLRTARDVQNRIQRGMDPVPPKLRLPDDVSPQSGRSGQAAPESSRADAKRPAGEVDFESVLHRFKQDPSLRYTETGRIFLRWLHSPRLLKASDWKEIVDFIPSHCAHDTILIARSCALSWLALADELDGRCKRMNNLPQGL
ncbi:MAG TPA: ParB/RepB/Spo0J family partition protein [Acidobacteriaceae bacterium]|nr:ParB/RepB/Spo0J family partition protein [Acidobacteriaceae bacterium]